MDFRERLAAGVIVGDGAWGTMLADRGLPAGAAPERWTLEHADVLAEIARAYADAGAELITTNTFGGSPIRLAHNGLAKEFEAINRRGVEIVRDAIGDRAFVSASMGPTGQLLAPLGDIEPDEVSRGFAQQARVLIDAGADLICVETMTAIDEATLAVAAIRSVSKEIPVIATMTFEITPRGPFTMMGISVPQAAAALEDAGATVVGANCGTGFEDMRVVAAAFAASTNLPLAMQPNAGLPIRRNGAILYPDSPEHFADGVAAFALIGVTIIGGCCGTTPAHIRAVRDNMSSRA